MTGVLEKQYSRSYIEMIGPFFETMLGVGFKEHVTWQLTHGTLCISTARQDYQASGWHEGLTAAIKEYHDSAMQTIKKKREKEKEKNPIETRSWPRAEANGARPRSDELSEEDEEEEEDDGNQHAGYSNEAEDIAAAQTGHTRRTRANIYGVEIGRSEFGTESRRDQFRHYSTRWHAFLGLTDRAEAGTRLGKRKREAWEASAEEARRRRFKKLRQVNIHGQLEQMIGPGAAFRGYQEQVIQAIFRGSTPIMQVTGTGGGKSLSFMLPAYCAGAEGSTIVIVPMVSLQQEIGAALRGERDRGVPVVIAGDEPGGGDRVGHPGVGQHQDVPRVREQIAGAAAVGPGGDRRVPHGLGRGRRVQARVEGVGTHGRAAESADGVNGDDAATG
ncbi:hypothetical protein BJ170DRAFT_599218 [Xylariales sp. AK1849]|nr:hypothetical protein BJ170DRAFT_599218 [Xylariales sp. AK1849]